MMHALMKAISKESKVAVGLAIVVICFAVAGCAWLKQPLDPAVSAAVGDARQLRGEVASEIQTLQAVLQALQDDPAITPEEADLLKSMQITLEDLETSMAAIDAWLVEANRIVDGTATNGDAVLKSGFILLRKIRDGG